MKTFAPTISFFVLFCGATHAQITDLVTGTATYGKYQLPFTRVRTTDDTASPIKSGVSGYEFEYNEQHTPIDPSALTLTKVAL